MSVFVDVVNSVVELTQTISNFFTTDLVDLLTRFTAWSIQWIVVAMWKAKLAGLIFSWGVAQQIITNLGISSYLNTAWASLNSQMLNMLTFIRVPDAVNMILSASVTKFVFKFLRF